MIEAKHPALSVTRQCALLGLPRSSFYQATACAAQRPENLRLMRAIDETYLAYPFFGSKGAKGVGARFVISKLVKNDWPDVVAGMARSLRIEYEGALYHVINRGNYRRDVFETVGAAQAFVTALEEATERYGWIVHAYVVMRNHFHLAVETPKPNLSDGMHWLQSTLATRFNRLRGERGHLFQGRYQALLMEDREILSRVVDYIHLNPVRAGIVAADQVNAFRWSSLTRFVRAPGQRFKGLEAQYWLEQHGWKDIAAGWESYVNHLRTLAEDEVEQQRLGFRSMSKGWLLGTHGWKKATAKDHAHLKLTAGVNREQARQLKEARWEQRLEQLQREMGKRSLKGGLKNQKWKIQIAAQLRSEEGASASWLARAMHLGTPATVRNYLCRYKSGN